MFVQFCAKSSHSGNEDLWRREGEGAQTLKCGHSECSMLLMTARCFHIVLLHDTRSSHPHQLGWNSVVLVKIGWETPSSVGHQKVRSAAGRELGNPQEGALLQAVVNCSIEGSQHPGWSPHSHSDEVKGCTSQVDAR